MKNQKRLFALLMVIGLVLTMVVSSAYIVLNVDHDCVGHDCDICEHIAEVREILQSMSLLGVLMMLLFMAAAIRRHIHVFDRGSLSAGNTLVGWKVRLNN